MKKFHILLLFVSIFFYSFIFAQTYKTIYKCDFEKSNYPEWNLINADTLKEITENDNIYDMFYIGSLTSYSGNKSLYISPDGGNTNQIEIGGTAEFYAGAELTLTLPPGEYTISFMYKTPFDQRLDIMLFGEKYNSDKILDTQILPKVEDWTLINLSYSLSEECNWIFFNYYYKQALFVEETVDGVAIDNIVIKKDVGPTYALSGIVTNNDIAVTSGTALLYEVHTLSQYSFVDTVSIASDGSYIFEEVIPGGYIIKAMSTDLENTVPTYYGDSVNYQHAKLINVNSSSIDNLDIVLVNSDNLDGGSGIGGYVEEDGEEEDGGGGKKAKSIRQAVANIDVRLERQNNDLWIVAAQTFSNSEGYYDFKNVAQGKYRVVIDFPGYPMISTHEIDITNNDDDIENINYIITKDGIIKDGGTIGIVSVTKGEGNMIVYPNPTSNKITVEIPENSNSVYFIYDTSGKELKRWREKSNKQTIDVSDLPNGTYILVVNQNGKLYSQNIIINK